MKQHLVCKSYRIDPDKLARAKKALGAASESEAVRMAIEAVIDHEETMALARKIMKRQSHALRELAAYDGEIGLDQDKGAGKPAMLPKQSKRASGKISAVARLIDRDRSEREESLLAAFKRGKERYAGKRNNQ